MQIPYETSARPDTGLYNAKLGIWLFLASEVMLFGGLFSAYVFLRMGADPGYWPHGLLNVPVGTMNTGILIASSVTVVLAWASLKMRQWTAYWWYMLITIICGALFLTVKLSYEWPQKFVHFGVFLKQEALAKPEYEKYLGNEKNLGGDQRLEITGHLEQMEILRGGKAEVVKGESEEEGLSPAKAAEILKDPAVKLVAYELHVDEKHIDIKNAAPGDRKVERPHFLWREPSHESVKIEGEDVASASAFYPRHSSYFSTYFLITGLHGLHVLGGVIVFLYFLLFGKKLYLRNPEHMANRVEVAGLFWHFVDLVWIFVFPIFYLL
jgi:cytochrome c oxidase subunit 3